MIEIKELYWAAGFLEGEGCFQACVNKRKNSPYPSHSFRVAAPQVQREPLERLQRLFGGTINFVPRANKNQENSSIWMWRIGSSGAISVMMTLHDLMSPWRQEQIRHAVTLWKTRPLAARDRTHCPQGHPLIKTYRFRGRVRRMCGVCQDNVRKARELRQRGIGPNSKQMELLN